MILVLLGTQDKSFKRLLLEVQRCIDDSIITESVVVQAGETRFSSEQMQVFKLISRDKLIELINQARIIITHAGVGSIMECIMRGKKVITVARLKIYKEHTNDHQLQIQKRFEEKGYIIPLYDVLNLGDVLQHVDQFKVIPYQSNAINFIKMIGDYLDSIN